MQIETYVLTAAPTDPCARRSLLPMCAHAQVRTRVLVLIRELNIRVITEDGALLRELTLDPNRDYQPQPQP